MGALHNMSMSKYYSALQDILDELEVYQLLVTDLNTLRRYRQNPVVAKFLVGLNSSLLTQVKGHILTGDSVPSLTTIYFRVFYLFT